jgi:hypothetical protein
MKNRTFQPYDLIGDIHGELDALRHLLGKLGYREEGGAFTHPEGRKLVFLGDYIDGGPGSRGVLRLVRRLVDEGIALAIMGNHEFNFIAYHTRDAAGLPLRSHDGDHNRQVAATLASFRGHEDEIGGWVEWMKGLPLFLDLGGLRVVHASWVPGDIGYLADKTLLDPDFLLEANRPGSDAWRAIGRVLKGVELGMPDGLIVKDSLGIPRGNMRIRWWGDLAGLTWREVAFPLVADLPEGEAEWNGLDGILSYGPEEPPVFFGHYKLTGHREGPQAENVATLDYGLGHGGPATAYRWSGERVLEPGNFVQVRAYEVFVDDNFAYMDEEGRSLAGRFYDYESALAAAKRIVDRSLAGNYEPGMSAEELEGRYRSFGEDAFVIPTPEDRPHFSAWSYARERAGEIAGGIPPA